jgi:hypothetical protein
MKTSKPKSKSTFTRDYYEVQFRGLDETTKDRWFISHRRAKTLDEARENLAEVRKHWKSCNRFLYTGSEPDRRIVHVVATCEVVQLD